MVSLTWGQVNAWRLSQQGLSHRWMAADIQQAVRQTMGIHAQVMSAAEMAISARVDAISPQAVQSALWQERSLVKTWLMRQTLHLVTADDFPLFIAARRITDINWPTLFNRNGIDRATYDSYIAVAPEILGNGPLTRRQFVQALDERLKSPELHTFLVKGSWGQAFKPLAWKGELCFGPGNGQNATFVRPSSWIGGLPETNPEAALQEIVRRYLRAYGPARPRNFQWWWWTSSVAVKKAFNSIADEIEEVEVEGWRAITLKAAIPSIMEIQPAGDVRLLPSFDAYIVGTARGKDLERLISMQHQKKVYRQQGWVSAVVLVNGFIKGIWEYKTAGSQFSVTINLFSSVSHTVKQGITQEAERLGKFLNCKLLVEFNQD